MQNFLYYVLSIKCYNAKLCLCTFLNDAVELNKQRSMPYGIKDIIISIVNDSIKAIILLNVLLLSNSSHEMSAQVAEDGKSQRLPVDGGRVYQEPGTTQATRRETGG